MKRLLTALLILSLPLSLSAMSQLTESDLSEVATSNSLVMKDTGSGRNWSLYFKNPDNINFFLTDEGSDTTRGIQSRQRSDSTLPDLTTVSVVGPEDPFNSGMYRIEFTNGLRRTDEGPTMVEVWLGGLPDMKNAGKMCDFYTNQIKSYTFPSSMLNISTH